MYSIPFFIHTNGSFSLFYWFRSLCKSKLNSSNSSSLRKTNTWIWKYLLKKISDKNSSQLNSGFHSNSNIKNCVVYCYKSTMLMVARLMDRLLHVVFCSSLFWVMKLGSYSVYIKVFMYLSSLLSLIITNVAVTRLITI